MEEAQKEKSSGATLEQDLKAGRGLLRAMVVCVLVVILIRSFLFEPFKIPTSSMVPTLHVGDHIFVSKFDYGLFLPFTKIEFLRLGSPKRGQVVVFIYPKDESMYYVKRIVGLPGDKIEFKDKELWVNGKLVPREPVVEPSEIEKIMAGVEKGGEFYRETLGESAHYIRHLGGSFGALSRQNVTDMVPEDSFLVAGDNRDESYDSRAWGFVPRKNLRGRARIIWLSLNLSAPPPANKVRWARIFSAIH